MNRRNATLALLLGPIALRAAVGAADAQQAGKVYRIGYLSAPSRESVCRQDPEGRQPRRPSCRAAHQVRAGRQSEDCEGVGTLDPTFAARKRRLCDSIIRLVANTPTDRKCQLTLH